MHLERSEDRLTITQDFIGSYGLYLFRSDSFWALSNSFLYLVERLKQGHSLTLNKRYADQLLALDLCSHAYGETLVNEIECLDRAAVVSIDIPTGGLHIGAVDYRENTVPLDTREGVELLDRWYTKWTGFIRSISTCAGGIRTDLSGGFDSRLTFGLFLGAGVDLGGIQVNSHHDGLHTHAEDFAIASSIAERLGFELNRPLRGGSPQVFTVDDALNISMYVKLGFHKELYWDTCRFDPPQFRFTGGGGECLRSYWGDGTAEGVGAFIEQRARRGGAYDADARELSRAVRSTLEDALAKIQKKFADYGREVPDGDLLQHLYRETRCRNHFGKALVEDFFGGTYNCTPLLDSDLHRLTLRGKGCADSNLLAAMVFSRYNEVLLDFGFEGGRDIDPATVAYARELNERYPLVSALAAQSRPASCIESGIMQSAISPADGVPLSSRPAPTSQEMRGVIKRAFLSPAIKGAFETLYSPRTYQRLRERWEQLDYFPESGAHAVIAIGSVYLDCLESDGMRAGQRIADFMLACASEGLEGVGTNLYASPVVARYVTARIDIKNAGADANRVEFATVEGLSADIITPKWFGDGGVGYVARSDRGWVHLVLRSVGVGRLSVTLRSEYARDAAGAHLMYWLDYASLVVNGAEQLDSPCAVCHDHPYRFAMDVVDGDIVDVVVAWRPHDAQQALPALPVRTTETVKAELATVCAERDAARAELAASRERERVLERKNRELRVTVRKLRARAKELNAQNRELRAANKKLSAKAASYRASLSWKIGRAVTWLPRKLRALLGR